MKSPAHFHQLRTACLPLIQGYHAGLLIWPDTVRILGYEKHSSDLLDTEDILSLILNRRAA